MQQCNAYEAYVGGVAVLATDEHDKSPMTPMDLPTSLIDGCSAPIVCVNLDGPKSVLYANEAFCTFLDYSKSAFYDIYRDGSHTLSELVYADDCSYVDHVLGTMESGVSELMQFRLRARDGSLRSISVMCELSSVPRHDRMAMLLQVDFHAIGYKGYAICDEYFGGLRQSIDWHAPYAVAEYTIGENGRFLFLNKHVLRSLGFTANMPEHTLGMHSSLFSMIPVGTVTRMTQRAFANATEDNRAVHANGYLYGIGSAGIELDGKIVKITGEVPGQAVYRFVGSAISDDEHSMRTEGLSKFVRASAEALAVFSFEKDLSFLRCLWTRVPSELGVFANISINLDDDGTRWNPISPLEARTNITRRFLDFRVGKAVPDLEEPIDFEWVVQDFSRRFNGNFLTLGDGSLYFILRDRNETPITDVEFGTFVSSATEPKEKDPDSKGTGHDGEQTEPQALGAETALSDVPQEAKLPEVNPDLVERFLATVPGMESLDPKVVADMLKTLAVTGSPPTPLATTRPGVLGLAFASSESDEDDPLGGKHVSIHTFGMFDVFVDGIPVSFKNESAKELLALIVNRRGGFVTSREATSTLWPEEPVSKTTMARYRKAAMRLGRTLEQYGVQAILEKDGGSRRINPSLVNCDLYSYLWDGHTDLFKGRYMSEYSWAEDYLAELLYNQGR